jgi:succinate dehydrogenase / fumarate reductase membrane anchor subunit
MVNPIKKADRTPVGAHYGWQDWLAQRITAVIMVLFSVVFIGFFVVHGSVSYGQWKALFGSNVFRVLAMMFLLAVYYHAWIGIRDVLMDYVKPVGIRLAMQVGVLLFLVACSIWSFSILWGSY